MSPTNTMNSGSMLPGTLWMEKLADGGEFCLRCGARIDNPIYIIHKNDYHFACPKCFEQECPDSPVAQLVKKACQSPVCEAPAQEKCTWCKEDFCMWHLGRLPVTKAFVCKKCADNNKRPAKFTTLKDLFACSAGCDNQADFYCNGCRTWVCPTHHSKVNDTLCVKCVMAY